MSTNQKRLSSLLAAALALLACAAFLFSGQAVVAKGKPGGGGDDTAPYRVTDLPGFDVGGSSQSFARAVSNPDADGTVLVVGHSWATDGEVHAVMWEVDTAGEVLAMSDLGILPGGTESEARAVNDVGMAVGYSTIDDPEFITHAVVFMPDGSIIDLETLGGDQSNAIGVNNPDVNGVVQVIGSAQLADGVNHGAYWEVDVLGNVFGPVDLTVAGDLFPGMGATVNNSGVMAGRSQWPASWAVATLAYFDADDILQTNQLGTLGGVYSEAHAVDDLGNVAGESSIADGEVRPFLWQANVMTDLGTLGGQSGGALGVNVVSSSVQVVGGSNTANGAGHAFFWENGTMTDLNGLIPGQPKWLLKQARAVNQAGQIVGLGRVGGRRGQEHAYLITPNPQ